MANPNLQSLNSRRRADQAGLGLVELMVSLTLGLLVVGAAIGVFVSNSQTYRATEDLGRVQESARVAYELMARDIREAAGNPCGRHLPVANVLQNAATNWFSNWTDGVLGVEGAFAIGQPANRVAGTDAIELKMGSGMGLTVETHNTTSANFKINRPNHGLQPDDVILVCDNRQGAITQVTNANQSNATIVHNTGTGTIGNCTKSLGVPVVCGCTAAACNDHQFGANSMIVRLQAVRWYVGTNANGGQSLYRSVLRNGAVGAPEEVVAGVDDMEITYLLPGSATYVDATAVGARWGEVLAARVEIQLEGDVRVGPNGEVIQRQLEHVVTLRNRTA
jgi:type IV pilus assembly protein PilW